MTMSFELDLDNIKINHHAKYPDQRTPHLHGHIKVI